MSWSFKLVTAPVETFDAATPGLVNWRSIDPGWGSGFEEYTEIDLGRFEPRLSVARSGKVALDLLDGSGRTGRVRRERLRLTLRVDEWSGDQWQALDRVLAARRLVMFSPWYDKYTAWCSLFGGYDDGGGFALVGESGAGQYTKRSASDYYESWHSGAAGLVVTGAGTAPKLTRGMVGKAILLERAVTSPKTSAWNWVAENGAVKTASEVSNVPFTTGTSCVLPARTSGDPALKLSSPPTLTSGQRYVVGVYLRGSGATSGVRLRVTHNSGSTNVESPDITLTDEWTLHEVTWSQVGTSVDVRVVNTNTSFGANVQVGAAFMQTGALATSPVQGSPSAPDRLLVSDQLRFGSGFTLAAWVKYRTAVSGDQYLLSFNDGSDGYVFLRNGTWYVWLTGAGTTSAVSTATPGEWTQVVVTVAGGAGGHEVRVFENGAQIAYNAYSSGLRVPAPSSYYIGSDQGLASPSGYGLDMPLDRVRLDTRPWSAADVLNDYTMLTDEGVRALLAKTSGRVFRVASYPQGFRFPFTDAIVGDLVLEQVGEIKAGLA